MHDDLMEGIRAMRFEETTPVQEKTIPPILKGRDIIGVAQTGTGKTAAYLLPVMNKMLEDGSAEKHHVNTLIIAPTRELAVQIDKQIEGFSYFAPVSSLPVYGGGDGMTWDQQKKALVEGADIIVATPGRIMSHLNLGYVKVDELQHLILDEADRMLDMGFHDDIMKIIKYLPENRQTLLFSATMPNEIRRLAKNILKDPVEVNIALSKPATGILQGAYCVYNGQKTELLKSLLRDRKLTSVLIFASTKLKVKDLEKELRALKFNCGSIHSDHEQQKREEVMLGFKNREIQILVATDIVSRGIDIDGIGLVVNYDVPGDAEDYVHRIGRTARADKTGVALTLINPDDMFKFSKIEQLIENEVMKIALPAHLGQGPKYEVRKKSGGKRGKGGKSQGKRNFKPRRNR